MDAEPTARDTRTVAVAGGTGAVGRHVVDAVRAAGATPVVLARSSGVDLTDGEGLDQALAGADVVVDVTSVATTRRRAAVEFFGTVTSNLLASGRRAGVAHHVALSVVGCDRVDVGHYAGKLRQEELVLTDERGSVLRATQFHEFAAQMVARARGPVIVPPMRCQPVAAREVAAALVEMALAPPAGRAPDLAGPEELLLVDMVRALLRARGERRLVVPLPVLGRVARSAAGGGLLPTGPGPRGQETFAEWLARSARPGAG